MSAYPPNASETIFTGATPSAQSLIASNSARTALQTRERKDVFGTSISSALTNRISSYFNADIINSNRYVRNIVGGGSITSASGECSVVNGTTSGDFSQLRSKQVLKYRSGYTSVGTFTCRFDTPTVNTSQYVGLGLASNHIYFGYDVGATASDSFCVEVAKGGEHEIRTLTISAAATAAETGTLILDGTSYTISLTNAGGDIDFTTYEVSVGDTYTGWVVTHIDNTIVFASETVGPRVGTFSFASTGAATGTFARSNTGVALTTDRVRLSAFNGETDAISALDPQAFNMYEIKFAYYGIGNIELNMYDSAQERFRLLHRFTYANSSTTLNMTTANLYLQAITADAGGATAKTLKLGGTSAGYFGPTGINGLVHYAKSNSKSILANTETNILVIKHRSTINNRFVNTNAILKTLSAGSDGTKNVVVRVYYNPTLSPTPSTTDYSNFQFIDEDESVALYDITSDTHSGGSLVFSQVLGKTDSSVLYMGDLDIVLERGDTLLITAESTGASDMDVSVSWGEDL